MKYYLLLGLVLLALPSIAEKREFKRYQSIIDRQMFGRPPDGFDPTKPASEASRNDQKQLSKEQEQLQSSIHFSMVNITPDGATAVGFTDNSDPKSPIHYYLKVGEKRNGWEVKSVDAIKATMTIAKNDIEVSLSLGASSAKDASANKRVGSSASSSPKIGGFSKKLSTSATKPMGGGNSIIQTLRERREQRAFEREQSRMQLDMEREKNKLELEAMKNAISAEKEQKRAQAAQEQAEAQSALEEARNAAAEAKAAAEQMRQEAAEARESAAREREAIEREREEFNNNSHRERIGNEKNQFIPPPL